MLKKQRKNKFTLSRMGLRTIWTVASCITVAALLLAHTFYLESKKEIINQFNTQQLMLAKEACMKMEEFYASLERTLRLTTYLMASGEPGTATPSRLTNLNKLYQSYRNTPLINIITIGSDGKILDVAGTALDENQMALNAVYDKAKIIQPRGIYTSPLMDILYSDGKAQKGFFMASRTSNSKSGKEHSPKEVTIIFSISLDRMLDKYIKHIKSGRKGHAWVLDGKGTLLFQAKHPEMVFRNIFYPDENCNQCHNEFLIERKMASGQTGMGRTQVAGYEDNLIAYHPVRLGEMKWSIAVTAPYSEVSLSINRLMKRNGLLIGLIILMFLGSGAFTTQYVKAAVKAEEEARYLKQEVALKTMLQKTDMEVVRLAAAIESMDTLVILTDLEGKIFYLNPSAEKSLAYTLQELSKKGAERLNGPSNPQHSYNSIIAATIEGGWEGEYHILKKDGTEIPVHLITSGVKDRDGQLISMTWSMRDLTETKKLQQRLVQHEKARALEVLAAGVAHNFNNILAGILANAQLLLRDLKSGRLDSAKFKERLEVIQDAVRNGAEMVNRIMLYTRKEEVSEPSNLNLNDIINQAIYTAQPEWINGAQGQESPITIETILNPIQLVEGIHSEFLEVFINILLNAVEAMPHGGKTTITTRQVDEYVQANITDTGEGMSEEICQQVFDPFFTTKGSANSGLGLSTSLGIIQRHKGQIEVTSKQGAGTTFTILFPSIKDTGGSETPGKIAESGRGATILVIEDDEHSCNVICSLLSSKGYAVCCKNDAQSGLDKFRKEQFDIVLTELAAYDSSGISVVSVIKELNPATSIVTMIEWLVGEEERVQLKENGIDFVLPKPIESDKLFNIVDRALQMKLNKLDHSRNSHFNRII